jgi:hypothetical protein
MADKQNRLGVQALFTLESASSSYLVMYLKMKCWPVTGQQAANEAI